MTVVGGIHVASIQIDFREIRLIDGDRRKGFEEFVCQIARRHPPESAVSFKRVEGAGGDGGVEGYWLQSNGKEHGYQAKYFLATKDIDWDQIDKSVRTALQQHPQLTTYTICLACDLTDRSGTLGRGKTGWEHWSAHKSKWQGWAQATGMQVAFQVWPKFELLSDLASSADRRGLTLFWFNSDVYSKERLADLFERAQADLGERFHPEDNVRISLSEALEGLRRSPQFRAGLSAWFAELPGTTKLLSSISYLKNKPQDGQLAALSEAALRISAIALEIEKSELEPFPLSQWQLAMASIGEALLPIREFLYAQSSEGSELDRNRLRAAQKDLGELDRYLDTKVPISLRGKERNPPLAADKYRLVVVVGEPGAGKSHLFADAVASALTENAPALLLLGQNIFGNDLRAAFLHNVGVPNEDFETVLQSLDAAAELSGQRALILIDALNDAGDLRIWRGSLAGFANDVLKFKHLSLGLSMRDEYYEILLPELIKQNCVKLYHHGIQGIEEQEQAAVQYFEKRGIARPTVPWLAPEFSNFLFLRTVCDAIAVTGHKEFPRGLRGSLDVLRYYLDGIDSKLRAAYPDFSMPTNVVVAVARSIAKWMANRKRDSIDAASAGDTCQAAFGTFGPSNAKSWFALLTSEGLFRKDHIIPDGAGESDDPFEAVIEVYRFSYQRFSDHLIVRALLETVTDPVHAFSAGGELAYLLEIDKWQWTSLWNALAVQIPERFTGVEVFDLLPEEIDSELDQAISDAFEQSLLWRSASAFSEKTRNYFNRLATEWSDPRVSILLRLATVRGHPWNADFLNTVLLNRSMPDRDSLWTVSINGASKDFDDPVWEIIGWALRAPLARAERETLRLTALTLCWFFTASNRTVRDTATKALIVVLGDSPNLTGPLLENFQSIDDLYVLERLCVTVFGASVRTTDAKTIEMLAEAVFTNIFDRPDVPLDLDLRDQAKGVLDYAKARNCLPTRVDYEKCVPPYKSDWPLDIPTEAKVKSIAKKAGDNSILNSVNSMGDFGRYKVEPAVGHFTNTPLTEERPLNADEKQAAFVESVATWSPKSQLAYMELMRAQDALKASQNVLAQTDGKAWIGIEFGKSELASEITARKRFIASLDKDQKQLFEKLLKPELLPLTSRRPVRDFPSFNVNAAKRWVASRAYRYGWTNKLFPNDTGRSDGRGRRPIIERIGKKYQWLALSELQARLADNVWVHARYPSHATTYDHPANGWFSRDVEPSFTKDISDSDTVHPWWLNGVFELTPMPNEKLSEWTFDDVVPNGSNWLDVVDAIGKKWLLLNTMWSVTEKRSDASAALLGFRRDVFVRVSTILVKKNQRDRVLQKLKGARLADPSGHETIDWTDGPFLMEYPWRHTWGNDEPFEADPWRVFAGVKYIRPVATHVWESHFDASLPEGSSMCVPHPWIGRELGLRPDLVELGSCKKEGNTNAVFCDPSFGTNRLSTALVDPDVFVEFLKGKGLECIWIVAGERNAYPSGHHGDYRCRSFAGLHYRKNDRWVSDTWHIDQSGKP